MSASLKISANTSEVKKSLLDLGKDVKSLGKTKVSVFSEDDRKFIKGELKQELGLMKTKLMENRAEIAKMIKAQNTLEKGTKAELENRKKILSAYQQQTRLAQQADRIQKQTKDLGGVGGAGGSGGGSGGVMGMIGKLGTLMGGAALAVGGLALVRGYQASKQFSEGAGNRVKLRGLGQESMNFGSPEELASAGMTEQDFIKRQISGTQRLGRAGASRESILQQSKFERSYGLDEGSMMNVSTSLRGSMGGKGADQVQAKLQAAIMTSGIEDAIGPYLEQVTDLLGDINKNGITNTDEMIRVFSELVKDGKRTPEQLAEAFKGVDAAVKGASGEANAFIQTAFSRGGIGGGTIGATRLAMSSGGIMGLNEEELSNRGYNPELIKNMKGAGFMSGVGDRSGAMLNQFKQSAGMGKGQNIGDITDINKMTGLSTMANGVLGTEGLQGFDALKMMEQVQNKQMSQKQFDEKLKDMKANKDPSVERLSKINASLEGQTTILKDINTNLMEVLGKTAVKAGNVATEADNALIEGTGNVARGIDQSTGVGDKAMSGASSMRKNLTGGGLGEKLYDSMFGDTTDEMIKLRMNAVDAKNAKISKKGVMPGATDESTSTSAPGPGNMEDAVAKGMTKAMQAQKAQSIQNNNKINVRVQNSDGSVTNKTHK